MNDSDVGQFAQVMAIIVAFVSCMLVIAKGAQVAFRPTKPRPAELLPPVVDEARFARLENAVETIAIEVERIAEAQRFTTKLLAAREERALPAPNERFGERGGERSRQRVTTPLP